MNRWDIFEKLFTSFLAVLQPFIIYFLYGDEHAISRAWDTPLQPMFIIVNALVSFFFFKIPKWRIPALLLLLLTSFSVTDHFVLHNIFAILFFIFSGVSLWTLKKFRYYLAIYLLSSLFLFHRLFWVETWGIITLVVYHIHTLLYSLRLMRNRSNSF
jgi:hypothetical protein